MEEYDWTAMLDNTKFLSQLQHRLSKESCVWGDPERLHIDETAEMVNTLFNTNSGSIYVGAHTFTGHNVSVLTGTHYIYKTGEERMMFPTDRRDIKIGAGVWLASNSTILGPCTIGDNSVIAAGAVVIPGTQVPPGAVYGGVPAKLIKHLDFTPQAEFLEGRIDMANDHEIVVNVEQIMQGIREQIKRETASMDIPAFKGVQPIKSVQMGRLVGGSTETQSDWDEMIASLQFINLNYDIPYYWDFGTRSLKTFAKRMVRKLLKCLIPPILEKQINFNAHIVRCLNNVRYRLEEDQAALSVCRQELETMRQSMADLRRELEDAKTTLKRNMEERVCSLENAVADQIDTLENDHAELEHFVAENVKQLTTEQERIESTMNARLTIEQERIESTVNARLDAYAEHCDNSVQQLQGDLALKAEQLRREQSEMQAVLCQHLQSIERDTDSVQASVARMILKRTNAETQTTVCGADTIVEQAKNMANAYEALDYFKFQNEFRGSRREIKERQSMYLPYFAKSDAPVLDIGCGRGEFLQLMKENDINAFGVDLYPEYVIEGELNGLDVRQGDGIEFLKNSSEQYGGIFVCQVVEHISMDQIQTLCKVAFEKLKPGACLVMETPNPVCLSMFTSSFYIDPSHQKPIHPLLLRYLAQEAGFTKVEIVYTEASRVEKELPMIKSESIENIDEVNAAILRVSDMLYGSLDYAVIATK